MKKISLLLSFVLASAFAFGQSVLLTPTTMNQNGGSSDNINIRNAASGNPNIAGIKHNGSIASPTATSAGNILMRFSGAGYGTSLTGERVIMDFTATQNWNGAANGTKITFRTTANGTVSPIDRMTIDENGFMGIGSGTPEFPLHLQSTSPILNSSTGAFSIGSTTGAHLNFDGNEINAWNNTAGNTLFLNYWSNAKVQIGNGSTGNLDVNGFSNLGDGAPAIKMKKLTGTTSSSATGSVSIPHGLTGTKILSIDVLVEYSSGDYIPPSYTPGTGFEYSYYLSGSNINILNISGASILSKPIKIIVTYEQ